MDDDAPSSSNDEGSRAERRASPRRKVTLFAAVSRPACGDGVAYVDDIGCKGARLRGCTGSPLAVGERVELRFMVPHLADPVEIEVTVRWVATHDHSSAGVCFNRGLRGREAWAIRRLRPGSRHGFLGSDGEV